MPWPKVYYYLAACTQLSTVHTPHYLPHGFSSFAFNLFIWTISKTLIFFGFRTIFFVFLIHQRGNCSAIGSRTFGSHVGISCPTHLTWNYRNSTFPVFSPSCSLYGFELFCEPFDWLDSNLRVRKILFPLKIHYPSEGVCIFSPLSILQRSFLERKQFAMKVFLELAEIEREHFKSIRES